MEEDKKLDNAPKDPKRGTIFLLAIIIGLLLGVVLTLLLVDIFGKKHATIVHFPTSDTTATPSSSSSKDTIVKFVIHKYEKDRLEESTTLQDTLTSDSTFTYEDSEDLIIDNIEDYNADEEHGKVLVSKMLNKFFVSVIYLNKDRVEDSEHPESKIQVQIWETPIKNKLSYQFDGEKLKIKGLVFDHVNIYFYKNRFYLVNKHHVYLLHQNTQYEPLVETHDLVF